MIFRGKPKIYSSFYRDFSEIADDFKKKTLPVFGHYFSPHRNRTLVPGVFTVQILL